MMIALIMTLTLTGTLHHSSPAFAKGQHRIAHGIIERIVSQRSSARTGTFHRYPPDTSMSCGALSRRR